MCVLIFCIIMTEGYGFIIVSDCKNVNMNQKSLRIVLGFSSFVPSRYLAGCTSHKMGPIFTRIAIKKEESLLRKKNHDRERRMTIEKEKSLLRKKNHY